MPYYTIVTRFVSLELQFPLKYPDLAARKRNIQPHSPIRSPKIYTKIRKEKRNRLIEITFSKYNTPMLFRVLRKNQPRKNSGDPRPQKERWGRAAISKLARARASLQPAVILLLSTRRIFLAFFCGRTRWLHATRLSLSPSLSSSARNFWDFFRFVLRIERYNSRVNRFFSHRCKV